MPSRLDPATLRHGQYATDANLSARIALHRRFSTHPQVWYHWVFDQLGLERFERLLEVGCGNALFWSENRERLPESLVVTLCDLSEGMLAAAREGLGGPPRFRFAQLDAGSLPFQTASFDVATAHHMLYHVAEPARALAELHRVVAPGGALFAATNGISHLAELDALLSSVGKTPLMSGHSLAFGLENGPGLVRECFAGVLVSRYPNRLEVRDPQAVVDYLLSADDLDPDQCADIRGKVQREIERRGHFQVSVDVGLIMARKPG